MAGGARPLVTGGGRLGRPGKPRSVHGTPGLLAESRGSKGAADKCTHTLYPGLLGRLPHFPWPWPGQPHAPLSSSLLRPGAEWLCIPCPAPLLEEPPLPHPRERPGQQSAQGPMGRERGVGPSRFLSFFPPEPPFPV